MTTRATFLTRIRGEMAKTRGLFPATPARVRRGRASGSMSCAGSSSSAGAEPRAFRAEFERVAGVFHRVPSAADGRLCSSASAGSATRAAWEWAPPRLRRRGADTDRAGIAVHAMAARCRRPPSDSGCATSSRRQTSASRRGPGHPGPAPWARSAAGRPRSHRCCRPASRALRRSASSRRSSRWYCARGVAEAPAAGEDGAVINSSPDRAVPPTSSHAHRGVHGPKESTPSRRGRSAGPWP